MNAMTSVHTPSTPTRRNETELCGAVRSVLWWDAESEFVILVLAGGENAKGPATSLENGQCPIESSPRVRYRFLGRWTHHARYGPQFSFESYTEDIPADKAGVIRYLEKTCRHIGPATAEKLWKLYGAGAVETLRTCPASVATALEMAETLMLDASEDLIAVADLERTNIELFGLFSGRGFHSSLTKACIERWGARAPHLIRRNPFRLLIQSLPSAGFKRCDKLYLDLGHPRSALKRQMLAAWSQLHNDNDGNTWHARGVVDRAIRELIAGTAADPERAIALGRRSGWLAVCERGGREWIAETEKATKEGQLAAKLRRMLEPTSSRWPFDFPTTEGVPPLSDHQREMISHALRRQVGILAGTPGTGKTFTTAAIIREVLKTQPSKAVAVCAPTGKAAVRVTEAMRRYGIDITATTIHSLLEIGRNGHDGKGWGFKRNASNPLEQQWLFIDEASMLDTSLACDLLTACPDSAHVLFVGDPYQLPPVGHGAPLRDMLASTLVPRGELFEIQRNAGRIVHACAAIKDGRRFEVSPRFDPDAGENLKWMEANNPAEQIALLESVLKAFAASHKFNPVTDCQILVPINEKSAISRVDLNLRLQGMLNPAGAADSPASTYRFGDKCICLKNGLNESLEWIRGMQPGLVDSYRADSVGGGTCYLANGEIGMVLAAGPGQAVVQFEAPRRIVRVKEGKGKKKEGEDANSPAESNFALAYAITGHKSQGSEWPVAIILVDEGGGFVANREWWYTCISRASKLTIVIGKRAVMERQCRRVGLQVRKTFLRELLEGEACK